MGGFAFAVQAIESSFAIVSVVSHDASTSSYEGVGSEVASQDDGVVAR